MWQSTDELIAYAKKDFVRRELTPAEREQFGLPPAPAAELAPSGARVGGVMPLVFALLAALPGALLIVRQNRGRARSPPRSARSTASPTRGRPARDLEPLKH